MLQTTTKLAQPLKPSELGRLRVDAQKLPAFNEAEQFQKAFRLASNFRTRDSRKSLLAIFANYAVIGICIFVSEKALFSQISGAMRSAIYGLACLVISSRIRAFENLVHEASHLNLFKNPSMHYSLQFLYAFPVFRVLEDYRREHLIHHQHLGDPTKDPDLIRIFELGLHNVPDNPVYYLISLPFSGRMHWEYLSTTFADFWISPSAYPGKAIFWVAPILGVYFNPGLARFAGLYYAVPFFLVLPIIRYWAEASEHLGMDMTGKFGNSRSNLGFSHMWFSKYPNQQLVPSRKSFKPLLIEYGTVHPHNDGYHAVHHLHAQVPFHQLPKAHEALMNENKAFQTKTVVSTGFVETLHQIAKKTITVKRT